MRVGRLVAVPLALSVTFFLSFAPGAAAAEHVVSVGASCTPTEVASGASTMCTATFSDTLGHGAASWAWDDGGAGGQFWPSADEQDTFYYPPANITEADLPVTLTATATCDGPESVSGSGSCTVTVAHKLSVSANCDPHTVTSGATTSCTATVTDSHGHGIASWAWDDGGIGGYFEPGSDVQNPVYHAPTVEGWLPGELTVTVTCEGSSPLTVSGTTWLDVMPPAAPTGTIAGTVTDAVTGQPIPVAEVWCGWGVIGRAGPDGAYLIPGLEEGTDYPVTAVASGYSWGWASGVTVVADQTTVVDFALMPLCEIPVEVGRGGSVRPMRVSADGTNHACWVTDVWAEGYDLGDERLIHVAADGGELWRGGVVPDLSSVSPDPGNGCWVGSYDGWVWRVDSDYGQSPGIPVGGGVCTVAADSADGSCWVGATSAPLIYAGRVQHLGSDGTPLWTSPEGLFYVPESLSVDPSDRSVWVADYGCYNAWGVHFGHRVTHLANDGTVLWSGAGFRAPRSVSVFPEDGSCWVADEDDFRLIHLAADGSELWSASLPQPTCVSVNPSDGSVWVGSAWGLLAHVSPEGSMLWWAWASDGIWSLSVDGADGSVWVAMPLEGEVVHVAPVSFPDVPATSWALRGIMACVAARIVGGYPDGLYHPEIVVTRDQMAVFISRALAGGDKGVPTPPATAHFPDVGTGHWAYKYVEYAYANNIVGGYWDGGYWPDQAVDRGQMAVFVARALAGSDAAVPTGPALATFPDVPNTGYGPSGTDPYWAYKHVEYLVSRGVVGGYWDGRYHPEWLVTRDQMAVFIKRAFWLPI